jgi:hypothetical protein
MSAVSPSKQLPSWGLAAVVVFTSQSAAAQSTDDRVRVDWHLAGSGSGTWEDTSQTSVQLTAAQFTLSTSGHAVVDTVTGSVISFGVSGVAFNERDGQVDYTYQDCPRLPSLFTTSALNLSVNGGTEPLKAYLAGWLLSIPPNALTIRDPFVNTEQPIALQVPYASSSGVQSQTITGSECICCSFSEYNTSPYRPCDCIPHDESTDTPVAASPFPFWGPPGDLVLDADGTFYSKTATITLYLDPYSNVGVPLSWTITVERGDCPVSPLTPLDAAAMPYESGNPVDRARLTPEMQAALACFESAVAEIGGTVTVTSAYRPPSYQDHLREVWEKWDSLKGRREPACQALRQEVEAEFKHHRLQESQRPAQASQHSVGRAFDANVGNLPVDQTADSLAAGCGLVRTVPVTDPVHFELR